MSSSFLAIILQVVLISTFCRGEYVRRIGLSVESQTPIHHSTVSISSLKSTAKSWRQILPGGAVDSIAQTEFQGQVQTKNNQQIPSLFHSEDDTIYDRYAACLAATEGLRRIRDQTLQSQKDEVNKKDSLSTRKNILEAKQWAVAVYAENASKVVEAMGMPVSQFNSIGRIVCSDDTLKQKVLEQAYLYRLQSNVELDEIPETVSKQQHKASKPFRPISRDILHNFCESMYEIEMLRRKQAEELKQTYELKELPSISNEPALRPLLDSRVRDAIDSFPILASNVVQEFGLNNEEFNQLLQRTKESTFFRWKVLRNIGRIEQQRSY